MNSARFHHAPATGGLPPACVSAVELAAVMGKNRARDDHHRRHICGVGVLPCRELVLRRGRDWPPRSRDIPPRAAPAETHPETGRWDPGEVCRKGCRPSLMERSDGGVAAWPTFLCPLRQFPRRGSEMPDGRQHLKRTRSKDHRRRRWAPMRHLSCTGAVSDQRRSLPVGNPASLGICPRMGDANTGSRI